VFGRSKKEEEAEARAQERRAKGACPGGEARLGRKQGGVGDHDECGRGDQ
jgi:hypothetical protein